MASRNASIATQNQTKQAVGAGFLMEANEENKRDRADESLIVTFPDRTFASNAIFLLPIKLTQSKSELWSTSSSSILEKSTGFTAVTAVVRLYSEMPETAAIRKNLPKKTTFRLETGYNSMTAVM